MIKQKTKKIKWPRRLINNAGESFELICGLSDSNSAIYRDEFGEECKMLRSGGKYWRAPNPKS